jgi:hypothetical protein
MVTNTVTETCSPFVKYLSYVSVERYTILIRCTHDTNYSH